MNTTTKRATIALGLLGALILATVQLPSDVAAQGSRYGGRFGELVKPSAVTDADWADTTEIKAVAATMATGSTDVFARGDHVHRMGTALITSGMIVDETIAAADIDTGAVATSEILDETIAAADIDTSAVTTSEILDETIAAADIDTSAVTTSEILDKTIALADMDTSSVDSVVVLDESLTSADILDGTLVNADVNASAGIVYTKLAFSDNIVAGDIATSAVTTTELLDKTIALADMDTSAVDSVTILDESIISEDIRDNEIVNADVNASAGITYGKLAFSNNIVAGDLATSSVETTEILDFTIAAADLDTASVTSIKMGQGATTLDTFVDTPMGIITYSWNSASEDGDKDIFLSVNTPAMEVLDVWSVCSTAEGGALTMTLRDASNGGGNAVTSALDCNVTTIERTTALTNSTFALGDTLAGNFSAAVGTAAGVTYVAYRRVP